MEFNTRVLIVDDQEEIYADFREMLLPKENRSASDELAAAFLEDDSGNGTSHLPIFELAYASSGDRACDLIKTAKQEHRPFAVAYIDIRMPPGMDGIETIRQIREFEEDIEIVIMTAYTDKSLPEIVTDMQLLHNCLLYTSPSPRD